MYTHQDDFGNAMEDRQYSIITMANIVGTLCGAALAWQLCRLLAIGSWLLFILIILSGAVLGFVLTMRWNGISLLEQIRLLIGFQLRVARKQTEIHPHAATLDRTDTLTLFDGDEIIVQPYSPEHEVADGIPQ
jgi:hypothetical protein